MQKIKRINSEFLREQQISNLNKSPIRRTNVLYPVTPGKSPIRCHTPVRNVSPIKNITYTNNIVSSKHPQYGTNRYISNVSPIRNRQNFPENISELSNGKNIKFIHCLTYDNLNENQKDKKYDFNPKSDRIMNEETRLFGALVSKLNSEKKGNQKGNQVNFKTSVFEDSNKKIIKQKQKKIIKNPPSAEGSFKKLLGTNIIDSILSGKKPRNISNEEEDISTNFQTYKVKEQVDELHSEKQLKYPKLLKKQSAPESIYRQKDPYESHKLINEQNNPKSQIEPNTKIFRDEQQPIVEEDSDFIDINLLLGKIANRQQKSANHIGGSMVRMSFNKVKESFTMDAYL